MAGHPDLGDRRATGDAEARVRHGAWMLVVLAVILAACDTFHTRSRPLLLDAPVVAVALKREIEATRGLRITGWIEDGDGLYVEITRGAASCWLHCVGGHAEIGTTWVGPPPDPAQAQAAAELQVVLESCVRRVVAARERPR